MARKSSSTISLLIYAVGGYLVYENWPAISAWASSMVAAPAAAAAVAPASAGTIVSTAAPVVTPTVSPAPVVQPAQPPVVPTGQAIQPMNPPGDVLPLFPGPGPAQRAPIHFAPASTLMPASAGTVVTLPPAPPVPHLPPAPPVPVTPSKAPVTPAVIRPVYGMPHYRGY